MPYPNVPLLFSGGGGTGRGGSQGSGSGGKGAGGGVSEDGGEPLGPDEPGGPNAEWFRGGTFDREGKFDRFLLSPTHPVGRHEFRWLRSTYGFGQGDAEFFERSIKRHLDESAEIIERPSVSDRNHPSVAYRQWEVLLPRFRGPNGSVVPLRTGWALDPRRDGPHFTNAYPLD